MPDNMMLWSAKSALMEFIIVKCWPFSLLRKFKELDGVFCLLSSGKRPQSTTGPGLSISCQKAQLFPCCSSHPCLPLLRETLGFHLSTHPPASLSTTNPWHSQDSLTKTHTHKLNSETSLNSVLGSPMFFFDCSILYCQVPKATIIRDPSLCSGQSPAPPKQPESISTIHICGTPGNKYLRH